MNPTLYILRQQLDSLSPSLFRANDAGVDIVFIEQTPSAVPYSVKGMAVTIEGMTVYDSRQTLTYDDLIEKIFSSEHIIVI